MSLPDKAYLQLTSDLRICRILNGLWQVSGGHGHIDPKRAISEMVSYHEAGFTTWDLADHYGPAEEFINEFRKRLSGRHGILELDRIQAFTKWVPRPGHMTRSVVEQAVDTSLQRMWLDKLDMLQFHWWEYRDPAYMDALGHLAALRNEGKIRHLGLTNFDTTRLEQITNAGIKIVSNQVQYSIIDQRPAEKMTAFCLRHGITLLTYGTLCGGLLSERYLGQPEPERAALNTASLRKYKTMIDAWGGWALFQELLQTLKTIADKYGVTVANVAVRFVLDQPTVAGVIVGTRLGVREHRVESERVFNFMLDADDLAAITNITRQSHDLMRVIGDCGDEYRR